MATTYALGTDTRLAGATEATYGVAPVGAGLYRMLPFSSLTVGGSRTLQEVILLDGTRRASNPTYGAPNVTGEVVIAQDVRTLGWWLTRLMGDPTTTGTGPYVHAFLSETVDLPSVTLEVGHPQIATPQFDVLSGCRLGGLSFQTSRDAPGLATIPIVGKRSTVAASAINTSPTLFVATLFKTARADLKIGATVVANVSSVTMDYSLNLDINEGLADDGEVEGVEPTRPSLTGTLSSRLGSGTGGLRPHVLTDGAFELLLTKTVGAHSLVYHAPRVFLEQTAVGVAGPGGVDVAYNWRAAFDTTAGYMLQVTLTNDVASY